MPVLKFNIDKAVAEKKNPLKENIEVKNNINIKNVQEKDLSLGETKKKGLKFDFEYSLDYSPNVGSLTLNGHMLYLGDKVTNPSTLVSNWKKDKKLPQEILVELVNNIIVRCGVKSLIMAQEVNLPPHIRFPIVSSKAEPEKYIG